MPSLRASPTPDPFLSAMRAGQPITDAFLIDVHAHIGWCHNMPRRHVDAASMLPVMDALGVDLACISSCLALGPDVRGGNQEVLEALTAYPDRFVGVAIVNPHYPDEVGPELERMFSRDGVGMIKVHPSFHAYPLDGPAYAPVWEFAERRQIPVLTHTWGEGRGFDHPFQAEAVARRHPRLSLILGHSGGSPAGVRACIEAAERTPNLYLDTGTSSMYRGVTELVVERLGPRRMLFGSDVTYTAHPPQVAKIAYARIPADDKREIFGMNLAGLLLQADVSLPVLDHLRSARFSS